MQVTSRIVTLSKSNFGNFIFFIKTPNLKIIKNMKNGIKDNPKNFTRLLKLRYMNLSGTDTLVFVYAVSSTSGVSEITYFSINCMAPSMFGLNPS